MLMTYFGLYDEAFYEEILWCLFYIIIEQICYAACIYDQQGQHVPHNTTW